MIAIMIINNAIIISDLHCGCRFGLSPPEIMLDGGNHHSASDDQLIMYEWWKELWGEWVPRVTHGEPYCIVLNGDAVDGVHHGSVSQISHNISDQRRIAKVILEPIVDKCEGRFFMVRGTTVHTGASGMNEETLAEELNAIPDDFNHYARNELYLKIGSALCHFAHHISVTGSMAYESTGLTKEFTEFCSDAARWKLPVPDVVVRSHRHRHIEVKVPTMNTYGYIFTTPAWQLKTPYVFRIPGGRITTPQIGASLIRQGDEDFFTRHKVWNVKRSKTVSRVGVNKKWRKARGGKNGRD